MCGEVVLVGVGECANSVRTVCEPQCLSMLHINAMEQIIIDGAEQGLATSTIRTKISNYRKKNNIPRGITLEKGRLDTLYKEHFVKGGGV